MKIELRDVAKGPARARALAPTSTVFESGEAVLVEAETEQRPTVLGLIASGRMRPDTGTVLLDGESNANAIRLHTALVDAPEVCDPAPDVTVYGLVEEELMFAGRASNLLAARRWLDASGFGGIGRMPIAAVAPRERISLLLELSALRSRVEAMVLVSPDRHGGDPRQWWRIAQDFATRGYAMLVIAGRASAMVLDEADAAAAPAAMTDGIPPTTDATTDATAAAAADDALTADALQPEATPATTEEPQKPPTEPDPADTPTVQQSQTATADTTQPQKPPAERAAAAAATAAATTTTDPTTADDSEEDER